MNSTDAERSAILIFVKAPEKGVVKTRLAATLGDEATLALYKSFVADMLAMLSGLERPLRIYFSPAGREKSVCSWLGNRYTLFPQQGRDLGEKMHNALAETFVSGVSRAILIGSDLPDLPPDIVTEAFTGLKHSPAVLGPGLDGGYYLIGFSADGFLPAVFADIPWSTAKVFARTGERFAAAGVRPQVLPPWNDIDTVADLRRLIVHARQNPSIAPHTRACLSRLDLPREVLW